MSINKERQPTLKVCAVEGNIGVGKSTLLDRKAFSSMAVQEPLQVWNRFIDKDGVPLLDAFYSNPQKYAFLFQVLALASRVESLRDRIAVEEERSKENPKDILLLTERSPEADKNVFASMLLPDGSLEQQVYQYVFSVFQTLFPRMHPDHTVLLQSSVEICAERIRRRNRSGEENIDHEYLQNLHESYEQMFNKVSPSDRSIIDSSGSLAETELALQRVLATLRDRP